MNNANRSYYLLDSIVLDILFALFVLSILVPMVVVVVNLCYAIIGRTIRRFTCKCCPCKLGRLKTVWIVDRLTLSIYSASGDDSLLREEPETEISSNLESKYIGDRPIHQGQRKGYLIFMLRANVISLILYISILFWDTFVGEESQTSECDDTHYCFLANESYISPIIQNCSTTADLSSLGNLTIVCYQFGLHAGDAAAKAGGLLVFGAGTLAHTARIIIFIYKKCCLRCIPLRYIDVIQPILACLAFALTIAVFVIELNLKRPGVLIARVGSYLQTFGIFAIISLGIATPWHVLFNGKENSKTLDPVPDIEAGEGGGSKYETEESARNKNSDGELENDPGTSMGDGSVEEEETDEKDSSSQV